ncbi:MAG: superoxide dismutase [Armatimonadetes bacterium]|nr:superoxide dismutase [Armatimonadota bacterium]
MKHELPPLPYDYNALEPHYDEETVRLHHDKHHATYVAGLNKAEEELEKARAAGDFATVQHWEKQLAFHGSGDVLHTLFWESMSPNGGGEPKDGLLELINKDFGGFDAFKKQFSAAAATVEGSGWAVLGYMPAFDKLYILQIENHQKLTVWGIRPILVVDVWEHAYYLKYQNRRPEWIENWWRIVNWENASKMLADAKCITSAPHTR